MSQPGDITPEQSSPRRVRLHELSDGQRFRTLATQRVGKRLANYDDIAGEGLGLAVAIPPPPAVGVARYLQVRLLHPDVLVEPIEEMVH